MKESDVAFNLFQLMYYKCYKVNFICGGSYIGFPERIKRKKVTINTKNTDEKLFSIHSNCCIKL